MWVNRITNSRLGDELDGKGQKNIKILICYSEYKGQKVQCRPVASVLPRFYLYQRLTFWGTQTFLIKL